MVKSELMEAVPLDPGDYGGSYKANAGRMSLDFVNTVSWPGRDRGHDWLDRPSNVVAWAVAVGALTDEEADGDRRFVRDRPGACDAVAAPRARATSRTSQMCSHRSPTVNDRRLRPSRS